MNSAQDDSPLETIFGWSAARFRDEVLGSVPYAQQKAMREIAPQLFTLDDADHVLASGLLVHPYVDLVKDGADVPVHAFTRPVEIGGRPAPSPVDPTRVLNFLGTGHTVILNSLQLYQPRVRDVARALAEALDLAVRCNCYITPPSAQGLAPHFDEHDVLVLQVEGHKRWSFYSDNEPEANHYRNWLSLPPNRRRELAGQEVDRQVTLSPGDCLYVRRGTMHAASTEKDELSCHLTFSLLGASEVEQAVDLLARVGARRSSVGSTFFSSPRSDREGAEARTFDIRCSLDAPLRVFEQHRMMEHIRSDDVLVRATGVTSRLEYDGDDVRLYVGRDIIPLPRAASDAVEMALRERSVSPGAFRQHGLNDKDATHLCRLLLAVGLLRPRD